jgi:hypothetical protein
VQPGGRLKVMLAGSKPVAQSGEALVSLVPPGEEAPER